MVWALSLLTARLVSCSLTPVEHPYGIHGLIVFGRLRGPRGHSVPYLHGTLSQG